MPATSAFSLSPTAAADAASPVDERMLIVKLKKERQAKDVGVRFNVAEDLKPGASSSAHVASILSVGENSPAANAGLLPGDVIKIISGRSIRSASEAAAILDMVQGDITIQVARPPAAKDAGALSPASILQSL